MTAGPFLVKRLEPKRLSELVAGDVFEHDGEAHTVRFPPERDGDWMYRVTTDRGPDVVKDYADTVGRVVSVKAFETLEEARAHVADLLPPGVVQLLVEGARIELPDGEIVVERPCREDLVEELKRLDWYRFNDYMATRLQSAHNNPARCRKVLCNLLNEAWAERYGTEAPPARHEMVPGSHERPGGPECHCGAAWSRWNDCCARTAEDGTEARA